MLLGKRASLKREGQTFLFTHMRTHTNSLSLQQFHEALYAIDWSKLPEEIQNSTVKV